MRRRILAALTGALIGITGGVVAASPAQAAWADCGNYPGTMCLFANDNWGTPIWRQFPSQMTACRNLSAENFNDKATIVSNNTSGHYILTVWEHSGCSGLSFDVGSGQYQNLTGNWWNDRASSVSVIAL